MSGVLTFVGAIIANIIIETSGMWGLRRIYKMHSKKLLSRIANRVKMDIPNNQHFVHGGEATRRFEFVAFVDNPTPLEMTLIESKTEVFNHDMPLDTIVGDEIKIPKETSHVRITLGYFNPVLCSVALPTTNDKWKLKSTLNFRCFYGNVPVSKESEYFSVICDGKWEAIREWVAKKKQNPAYGGGNNV